MASRIGGAIPAVLSLAKFMRFLVHLGAGECNSVALRHQPWSSCYVPRVRGATNGKEGGGFGRLALARRTGFWHIRTALLSQSAAATRRGRKRHLTAAE